MMAPPILFIHGAFCGGWAFDDFRTAFEAIGYETHAPNLPHHERGADLDLLAQTGVAEYADAFADYARELSGPPILIGHSLGGLVAQLVAVRMPCAALVLLAPSAPWGVPPTTINETSNAFGVAMLGDYWRRPIPPDFRVARQTTPFPAGIRPRDHGGRALVARPLHGCGGAGLPDPGAGARHRRGRGSGEFLHHRAARRGALPRRASAIPRISRDEPLAHRGAGMARSGGAYA
jgi:pimeloyl-ACP methyl ester carboxylesterase